MKNPVNQHNWLNYLNPITLSILGTFAISDVASAKPLCYMIDANGRQVNLSFLCFTAKSSTLVTPNSIKSTTTTPTTPTTPPPPNATAPETSPPPQGETNATEKPEVDRSKLPPVQRAIPLLQNQKTSQINN